MSTVAVISSIPPFFTDGPALVLILNTVMREGAEEADYVGGDRSVVQYRNPLGSG